MQGASRVFIVVFLSWLFTVLEPTDEINIISSQDLYDKRRSALIDAEMTIMVGGALKLTEEENMANEYLMKEKYAEVDECFLDESKFNPAWHFFDRKERIEKSEVFKFIRKMPKGAVLHVHDTAMIGHEYVIKNITYRSDLYICVLKDDIKLIFSAQTPNTDNCKWELLKDLRDRSGDVDEFDANLAKYISLEFVSAADRTDNYVMWDRFMKIFQIVTPLLTYKPVWEDYFYEALRQYRDDKVFYVEVRTTLPALYELDGTFLDPIETAKVYERVSRKFVQDYPDTFGSRMIYAPGRFVDPSGVQEYIQILNKLKKEVGDYVAGFDLVGQEDTGKTLVEYIKQLSELVGQTNVFYHAGETNWYGMPTDYNLYDAVLLGAKRIGHGFALTKHPVIAGIVKDKEMAIEVNPISNQVLMLVDDMRNHPASVMIAQNMPIVVSSDDPGLWGALPLSHDVYELFVGAASRHADLKLLKQLSLNSIKYSSMPPKEMSQAMERFEEEWDAFVRSYVNETY